MADRTTFKLLPRPFTHRWRPRTLLHCITGYVHSPKAQAFCPSYAHKTLDFPTMSSLSFSPLEFFYRMSLINYQAQREKKPHQQPSSPSKKSPTNSRFKSYYTSDLPHSTPSPHPKIIFPPFTQQTPYSVLPSCPFFLPWLPPQA